MKGGETARDLPETLDKKPGHVVLRKLWLVFFINCFLIPGDCESHNSKETKGLLCEIRSMLGGEDGFANYRQV